MVRGTAPALVLLALAWCIYLVLHSLLASLTVKRKIAAHWPWALRGYRLAFNAQAVALGAALVWWMEALKSPSLWAWRGAAGWLADGLALAAMLGFAYSLKYYDTREFFGFAQWRRPQAAVEDQERFTISPLHRYVRHPWYSLGLIALWTRDMDAARLAVAVIVTLYLIVGSRLEERKLLCYHGDTYKKYRAQVPAFVPSIGRHLTPSQAVQLQAEADAEAAVPISVR